jgi:hypothetical protein
VPRKVGGAIRRRFSRALAEGESDPGDPVRPDRFAEKGHGEGGRRHRAEGLEEQGAMHAEALDGGEQRRVSQGQQAGGFSEQGSVGHGGCLRGGS